MSVSRRRFCEWLTVGSGLLGGSPSEVISRLENFAEIDASLPRKMNREKVDNHTAGHDDDLAH